MMNGVKVHNENRQITMNAYAVQIRSHHLHTCIYLPPTGENLCTSKVTETLGHLNMHAARRIAIDHSRDKPNKHTTHTAHTVVFCFYFR
jgi:hypothetical protein